MSLHQVNDITTLQQFFNFFIVAPQILNALIGGPIVKNLYGGNAMYAIVTSGVLMVVAAFTLRGVKDEDEVPAS